MFVVSIFASSFTQIILPFISEREVKSQKVSSFFSSIFSSSLILSIFIFFLYNLISFSYFYYLMPKNESILYFNFTFSLIILFSINISLIIGALNAYKEFTFTALQVSVRSYSVIISILFLSKVFGFFSVVIGYVLGELLRGIVSFVKIKKYISIGISFRDLKESFSFFKVSGLQSAAIVVWSINPVVDMFMASNSGVGSISKIQYTFKLISVPISLISLAAITVFYSFYSELFYKEGLAALKNKSKKFLMYSIPVLFTLILISYPFAKNILKLFFGYRSDFNYLGILGIFYFYLPVILPSIVSLFFVRMIQILKKTHIILIVSSLSFVCNIIFNLIFLNLFGLKGIALSTTMILFVQSVFIVIFFFKSKDSEKQNV